MSYSVPDAPVLLAPIFLDLNQHPQRGHASCRSRSVLLCMELPGAARGAARR